MKRLIFIRPQFSRFPITKEIQSASGYVKNTMTHKKPHLPEKICLVCQRPFAWRKKWERDWPQVKYCSERCKRQAKKETV
ncbi:DUF2256 domain-containing protein [Marinomonas shanghaiensis]|jgi:hypothetical protein|uniref:DUF2256 domain-containing protein n=1 Tax=Marinomonas shanghaiensis TaxID=2202418 RepID=UPI002FCD9B63